MQAVTQWDRNIDIVQYHDDLLHSALIHYNIQLIANICKCSQDIKNFWNFV